MRRKPRFEAGTPVGPGPAVAPGPASDKVRAVAFRIEDRVYEGCSGASHISLYNALLIEKQVPVATLDTWTSDEENHGFVTEKGEFLGRIEVFQRFGASRSQDLQAKGFLKPGR
jgi:hypothetical protein